MYVEGAYWFLFGAPGLRKCQYPQIFVDETFGGMRLFILLSKALEKPIERFFSPLRLFYCLPNFISLAIHFTERTRNVISFLWNMSLVAAGGLPTLFCRLWSKWLRRSGLPLQPPDAPGSMELNTWPQELCLCLLSLYPAVLEPVLEYFRLFLAAQN